MMDAQPQTRPRLGETVHFVPRHDGTCKAALVNGRVPVINPGRWPILDLTVLHRTLPPSNETSIAYADAQEMTPGTWHWGCGK